MGYYLARYLKAKTLQKYPQTILNSTDLLNYGQQLNCDIELSKNLKAMEITTGVGRIAMAVLKVNFNRVDILQVLHN